MNLEAVEELTERFPDTGKLYLLKAEGITFPQHLAQSWQNATIFVIDVSEGDKIPRKGGPGITNSDLLVINKIDIAPYVDANLDVMQRDSKLMRKERPFIFTDIRSNKNVHEVVVWIKRNVLLEDLQSDG